MAIVKSVKHPLALSITLGGICVILAVAIVFVKTRTTDCTAHSSDCPTETTAAVGNSIPTVGTVYVNTTGNLADDQGYTSGTPISLTAGGTKTVHVVADVTELNGVGTTALSEGDLNAVAVSLSKSGTACSPDSGTPDENNCYLAMTQASGSPADCTLTFTSSTVVKVDCPIDVSFFADPTYTGDSGTEADSTWVANVYTMDTYQQAHSAISTGTAVYPEVDSLVALSFPPALDYGSSLAVGETTSPVSYTVTQFGNVATDATVKGSGTATADHTGALTCTAGYIDVSSQKWALTSGGSYTSLTTSAVNTLLDIGVRTSESTALTKDLFWTLDVPSNVGGSCTGTTTFTATAH